MAFPEGMEIGQWRQPVLQQVRIDLVQRTEMNDTVGVI
jgi:hypothetical protein